MKIFFFTLYISLHQAFSMECAVSSQDLPALQDRYSGAVILLFVWHYNSICCQSPCADWPQHCYRNKKAVRDVLESLYLTEISPYRHSVVETLTA